MSRPKFGWVFRTLISHAHEVTYDVVHEQPPNSSEWKFDTVKTVNALVPGARTYYIVGTDGHMYYKEEGRDRGAFALPDLFDYDQNEAGLAGRVALNTGKLGRNTVFVSNNSRFRYVLRGYLQEYLALQFFDKKLA
jgi:hypothetical protein